MKECRRGLGGDFGADLPRVHALAVVGGAGMPREPAPGWLLEAEQAFAVAEQNFVEHLCG